MGLFKFILDNNTDKDDSDEPKDEDSKKGIFEGGNELTIEDMCIMDILDGDEW